MAGKNKSIPVPTESQEQQALFNWIRLSCGKYPQLEWAFHIPNEGKRSKSSGAKLKCEGLAPGVSDICVPVARGKYHALYIELKRREGGRVSANQSRWIDGMIALGNFAKVCYGWDEARQTIEWYMNL